MPPFGQDHPANAETLRCARRFAALFLCALLITACESIPLLSESPGPTAEPATEAASEQAVAEAPPAPQPEASVPPEFALPEARVTAIPPAPREPVIDDDPVRLIGMGPASLSAFLGAPQLIRRESPASLWQYRTEGCVLDVVLYPEKGTDRVSYVEARKDGLLKIPARACLNRLLRDRRAARAG